MLGCWCFAHIGHQDLCLSQLNISDPLHRSPSSVPRLDQQALSAGARTGRRTSPSLPSPPCEEAPGCPGATSVDQCLASPHSLFLTTAYYAAKCFFSPGDSNCISGASAQKRMSEAATSVGAPCCFADESDGSVGHGAMESALFTCDTTPPHVRCSIISLRNHVLAVLRIHPSEIGSAKMSRRAPASGVTR